MNEKILHQIFDVAEQLLPTFITAHKDELGGREGIYITVAECTKKFEVRGCKIGNIPEDKIVEKDTLSHEKLNRLIQKNKEDPNQLSSFQSENIFKKEYGGAIFTGMYFLSGSGFPPHLDQKFMLLVAYVCGIISTAQMALIDIYTKDAQNRSIAGY